MESEIVGTKHQHQIRININSNYYRLKQGVPKQGQGASVQKTVWTVKRCIYMEVYWL